MSNQKALIAMSGGVDSSVAAYLIKEQGYDCIGCTMKLYSNPDIGMELTKTCCAADDVEDARSVAYRLGMPYYVFNFSDLFKEKVMDPFVCSYLSGRTPNPCIDCNRYLKFDKLAERAKVLGCDYVVSGHYARIEKQGDKYLLKRAADLSKDQSYVLYSLTQEGLAHTLFPLGELTKPQVRAIAEANGFINANKPDSQDICFVPDGNYAAFIERQLGRECEPGNFVDTSGKILGPHKGIARYTIGQHRGLGETLPGKMYVLRINAEDNTVVLGSNEELFKRDVQVSEFNWISGDAPKEEIHCQAKIRYAHKPQPCTVKAAADGSVEILFDEPQRAATPGQAAVLYDGDIVLGGGRII